MSQVTVVSVEEDGYFVGGGTSGATVKVTLERNAGEFASCEGILIWDEEDENSNLDDMFEEWEEMAATGEEGYKYWETA